MTQARQQTILGGRYVLGDELGRGGIGVVYVGYDRRTKRSVAVKVLRPDHTEDADALARFEQEDRIARQISHENVAEVYDFGRDGDTRYLVLELLGPTLKDLLDRRKRLPPKRAAHVVSQVLAGLGAAHRAGIVHRDVKPQNVLFVEQPDGTDPLKVKLVDFGIARIASARTHTAAGRFFGTVHYVSPEQATGQQVGPASDIYSAGVLLYQLLTGVVPFDGEDDLAVLNRHVGEPPVPPSRLAPGIPPRLDAIVLRALEKDPERRWPDAETMADALDTYDQPSTRWPEEDPTRGASVASDTRAWTASKAPATNGKPSRDATVRLDAVAPPRPRRPEVKDSTWRASVAFVAIIFVAVLLGVLLAIVALDSTALHIGQIGQIGHTGVPSGVATTPVPASTPAPSGQATPTPTDRATPTPGATAAVVATGLTLSADDFVGGCLAGILPSRLLAGTLILDQTSTCPSATAQFGLATRPRGAATLQLSALNSPLGAPEVAVLVDDRPVFRGQLNLPTDGGSGGATITLPDGTLRAGSNLIEVRNLATDSPPEVGPWLILFGAVISWR